MRGKGHGGGRCRGRIDVFKGCIVPEARSGIAAEVYDFGMATCPHTVIGSERFRLFGSIGSPYALKLRAILRYRRLPFDWIPASLDWVPEGLSRPALSDIARAEIAHVRPPVIPVVQFPRDGAYRNDSTWVAVALEAENAARSIIPPDPGWAFLSHLLEDMADEWGVKIAFHYRWAHEQDRVFKSRIVAGELLGGGFDGSTQIAAADHFAARQFGRMPLVGCTQENAPLIEETFRRVLAITDEVLVFSTFLFGQRPTLADFGWYGQLQSLATDPTPWAIMRKTSPGTFTYLQLLEDASGMNEDAWLDPASRPPRAALKLLKLAGEVYLPFLVANAQAFDQKRDTFDFLALGHRYSQATFKYQVKCLRWLKEELAIVKGSSREWAETILCETGCLDYLAS